MAWVEGLDILRLRVMIKFERPEYILFLIPALVAYSVLLAYTRRNYFKLCRILIPVKKRGSWVRNLVVFSKLLLLLLLAASLCQPYMEKIEKRPIEIGDLEAMKKVPALIMLLIDVSKSMEYGNRIREAEAFMLNLFSQFGDEDQIAVVFFAGEAEIVYEGPPSNFTVDLKAGKRYSAIGDALSLALSYSRASNLPVGVILVTDGGWNYGSDPVQVAKSYGDVPLAVVHVGFGASSNPELLMEVAEASNGWYYEVTWEGLKSLTENLYSEVKYAALASRGKNYVEYTVKDYALPQLAIWAIFSIILPLTLVDGV